MSTVSPYCTSDDIRATLPRVLGNVASPNALITISRITELCGIISAEMDSRFSLAGYVVPIDVSSNERLRKDLNRIAINGVCAGVLHTIYKTGEVNFQLGSDYRAQYYRDISLKETSGFGDDNVERKQNQRGGPRIGPDYNPKFKIGQRIV